MDDNFHPGDIVQIFEPTKEGRIGRVLEVKRKYLWVRLAGHKQRTRAKKDNTYIVSAVEREAGKNE